MRSINNKAGTLNGGDKEKAWSLRNEGRCCPRQEAPGWVRGGERGLGVRWSLLVWKRIWTNSWQL